MAERRLVEQRYVRRVVAVGVERQPEVRGLAWVRAVVGRGVLVRRVDEVLDVTGVRAVVLAGPPEFRLARELADVHDMAARAERRSLRPGHEVLLRSQPAGAGVVVVAV